MKRGPLALVVATAVGFEQISGRRNVHIPIDFDPGVYCAEHFDGNNSNVQKQLLFKPASNNSTG